MGRLNLKLLGTPAVHHSGQALDFPTRKVLALLIYLAVEGGRHSRDKITALFWPESDERHSRAAFRNTLARLRATLGAATEPGAYEQLPTPSHHLIVGRDSIGFDFTSNYELDLDTLRAAVKAVRDTPVEPSRADLLSQMHAAAALYRGDFLEGFSLTDAPDFDDWASVQREAWHRRMSVVFDRLSQWQVEGGNIAAAIETASRWISHDQLDEAAHRRLMQLHFAAGDRAAALKAHEACRSILATELNAEPSPETEALAARIHAEAPPHRAQRQPRVPQADSPLAIIEAPLVGRAVEHHELVTAYYAAREGLQVVTLEGEAGIGKTRLATTFLRWAAMQGADVLQGQAFETGGRLPYQALVEALRKRLQPGDMRALLSEVWLAELSRLLPELRDRYPELPAPTREEAAARTRLFEAVARLGEALARRAPLALFIDDLHWADAATLDLLHYAYRRWAESGAQVLLLLSLRVEELASAPLVGEWLEGIGRDVSLKRMSVGPLSSEDTLQWVEALVEEGEGAVERFSEWLFAETGGQPFFIVETLKALLERGVLKEGESTAGERALAVQTDLLERVRWSGLLPPGVRSVIHARLSRLSPAARALLGAGAVLGQHFDFEHLRQVAGLSEDEGLPALDELLSSRLLVKSGDDGRSVAAHHTFTHDKIRDVAYAEMGDARQNIFHRRALETLQAAAAPAAVLAHHAWAAGLIEPAYHFGLVAGDEAARLFANREARAHYDRAFKAVSQLPDTEETRRRRVDAFIKRAAVPIFSGNPEHELARLAEAESLARRLLGPDGKPGGDRLRLARVHYWTGRMLINNNRPREAAGHFEQVLVVAQEFGDEELLALPSAVIGTGLVIRGQFGKAGALLAQAVPLLEKVANWPEWIWALGQLGWSLAMRGHVAAGLAEVERALARARELNNLTAIAQCHILLCPIYLQGRDLLCALEQSRLAIEVAEQSRDRVIVYWGYGGRAWAESHLGKHESAIASVAQAQALGQRIGGHPVLSDWLAAIHAEVVLKAGHHEEACTLAQQAVAFAQSIGGIFSEAMAQRTWGQALATLNPRRWEEAEAHLASGLQLFEAGEAVLEAARTHVAWGMLCRDRGDAASALDHLEKAAAQFESSGLPGELEPVRHAIEEIKASAKVTKDTK